MNGLTLLILAGLFSMVILSSENPKMFDRLTNWRNK